mgnify:CR=1 FL=1
MVRNGLTERADIAILGDKIERIAADIQPADNDKIYDCTGLTIMSGLVDLHVHLREPGFSAKETIATGTAAAAHGGFTTVCSMPNLAPAPDSMANLQQQLDIIERDAVIKVLPYATITRKRFGDELVNFEELKPYVAGFSDDGTGVQSEDVMRQAMAEAAKTDTIIAAHCEVDELLRGGYIHDGEYARINGHRGICSESEWQQVERDIESVAEAGCRYHVCHISTKESVDIIRKAKAEGVDITCETGPHYLVMDDSMLQEDGRFKMNPPLRSRADMDALIEGIADGTIDMLATDHAPHSAEEKSRGLKDSAMGIVGLETAFAACYTKLVKGGIISLEKLIELMSKNPRERFGIKSDVGCSVWALDEEYEIDPEDFLTMGRATPFKGERVAGKCLATVYEGKAVYVDEKIK